MKHAKEPPLNLTDWQILQLKRTNSSLRSLNRQVFHELQGIRRNGLSRGQYRDAGQFFQTMAIRMMSDMRVHEAIVAAGRKQGVGLCKLIIGRNCECSAKVPADNKTVSNGALKVDPGYHEEVDSLLELLLRTDECEPEYCRSRRLPPGCFFVGLDRIISAVLRQQRHLQSQSSKQAPAIEVIEMDHCIGCGSTGDETLESK